MSRADDIKNFDDQQRISRAVEVSNQTLGAYLNEIKELRDTVKKLEHERIELLREAHHWRIQFETCQEDQ